jgi:hypothetical protein
LGNVMLLSWCEQKGQGIAECLHLDMNLGAETTATRVPFGC